MKVQAHRTSGHQSDGPELSQNFITDTELDYILMDQSPAWTEMEISANAFRIDNNNNNIYL